MDKDKWTIGKGIAVGLKYLSIMGIVIALFAFAQFVMKFYSGYYEIPEREIKVELREIDENGCLLTAGYTYNASRGECIREWSREVQ